jgi:hypothetical protein
MFTLPTFDDLLMSLFGMTRTQLLDKDHARDLHTTQDAIWREMTRLHNEAQPPVNRFSDDPYRPLMASFAIPITDFEWSAEAGGNLRIEYIEHSILSVPVPGCLLGAIGRSELPWTDADLRLSAKARNPEFMKVFLKDRARLQKIAQFREKGRKVS